MFSSFSHYIWLEKHIVSDKYVKKPSKKYKKLFWLLIHIAQVPFECRKNYFTFKTQIFEILFLLAEENASFPITLVIHALVSICFAHKGLFRGFNDNSFRKKVDLFILQRMVAAVLPNFRTFEFLTGNLNYLLWNWLLKLSSFTLLQFSFDLLNAQPALFLNVHQQTFKFQSN